MKKKLLLIVILWSSILPLLIPLNSNAAETTAASVTTAANNNSTDAVSLLAIVNWAKQADPEYQKAVINRQAAILTSRLIRFQPLDGDESTFA